MPNYINYVTCFYTVLSLFKVFNFASCNLHYWHKLSQNMCVLQRWVQLQNWFTTIPFSMPLRVVLANTILQLLSYNWQFVEGARSVPCAECIDCRPILHGGHGTWFVHMPSGEHWRTVQAPRRSSPKIRGYVEQLPPGRVTSKPDALLYNRN